MDLRVHPGQSSAQPPVKLLQVVPDVGEGELQLPQTAELLLEPAEVQADPFCPLKAQNKVKPGCLSAQRLLLQKRLPVRRLRLCSLPARAAGCTRLGARLPGAQEARLEWQMCNCVQLCCCCIVCCIVCCTAIMLHCVQSAAAALYAALCAMCPLLHCMLHCMLTIAALCAMCCCCTVC